MFRLIILSSLIVTIYCSKQEEPNKYEDQMTETDWHYIYNNTCARMSFETKRVHTFKGVENRMIVCEPFKNESGNFMRMNTTILPPIEEIDEIPTEN